MNVCITCLGKARISYDARCLESKQCEVCNIPDSCITISKVIYKALAKPKEDDMARNTGAPKTTPREPLRALRMMTDVDLYNIVTDNDCSEYYRGCAQQVIDERRQGHVTPHD